MFWVHFSDLLSHIYVAGILTCERHFCGSRHPPFGVYILVNFTWAIVTHTSLRQLKMFGQAKTNLVDIFGRIELFFRRLEIYTEVQSSPEMMDIIIQIIVEVLSILGIVTKEIKQGRLSKYSLYKYVTVTVIERFSEKYAKKLIGRTDIEDALKRLDKLTHEEAWMGIAQNLRATHTVGESVRGVADKVVAVDDRVAGVDDRVRVVDDRVAEVIRGA